MMQAKKLGGRVKGTAPPSSGRSEGWEVRLTATERNSHCERSSLSRGRHSGRAWPWKPEWRLQSPPAATEASQQVAASKPPQSWLGGTLEQAGRQEPEEEEEAGSIQIQTQASWKQWIGRGGSAQLSRRDGKGKK